MKDKGYSLWSYSFQDRKSTPFGDVSSTLPINAVFSPDGKWVAYTQTDSESPSGSIFVQPFPSTGAKYQVSTLGNHALWSPDGNELFYVPSVTQFLAVSVRFDPSVSFSNPTTVPRGFSEASTMIVRNHDITPDGKFIGKLGASSRSAIANVPIQVVINWFEDLRQRIPAH